jgi:hypothetical protein
MRVAGASHGPFIETEYCFIACQSIVQCSLNAIGQQSWSGIMFSQTQLWENQCLSVTQSLPAILCIPTPAVGYFFGYAIGGSLVLLCYLGVLSYFAAAAFTWFRTVMMCLILVRQWLYENGRFVSLLFTLVLLTLLGSSVYGTVHARKFLMLRVVNEHPTIAKN